MSLNFSHIPYERLVDRAEGRLARTQTAALDEHLAGCVRCREEAARIERMVAAMRHDESIDAPPALVARAVALFRARAVEPAPSLFQRLVAALSFENTALTPAFGLRSSGSGERQMIFTANEYDVDLRMAAGEAGWVISGQLLGAAATSGAATLANEAASQTVVLGEELTFAFPLVAAGRFVLTLRFDQIEFVVEEIVVGDA
ncbi:MAG: zf-HC2 domain-containing protein [Caldilinea sp.]